MGVYRIRNSTPLLPRVLSQHSVISIDVVGDVSVVIVIRVLIGFSEATRVRMGVSAHVDTTIATEVATVVTTLTTTMGANAVIETGGGAVTGGTFGAEDGGKSVSARRGNSSDMRTRTGGDTFV